MPGGDVKITGEGFTEHLVGRWERNSIWGGKSGSGSGIFSLSCVLRSLG